MYEVGKTYKHNGKIKLCESGFHACHELHQVWQFYPNNGNNVFYEVECDGEIIDSEHNDGKFVCSEITLIKEVDISDVEKFDFCQQFYDNFAYIIKFKDENGKNKNKKYNFIDTKGKLISERWWLDVSSFCDGVACVKSGNGRYIEINTKGELIKKQ